MNNKRIGKIGTTLILGLLSAICGFVAVQIVKDTDEKECQPISVDDHESDE